MKMLLAAAYLCSPLLLGGCIVDDHEPRVHEHEYDHEHEHEHEMHHDLDHDHDRDGPR
ncbi:MAG TPA: hypothetical protein VKP60_21895 [Magnetospirillaceae bacterium]|nr:hypothetical protein [Magnetospirillaceae bacterium]